MILKKKNLNFIAILLFITFALCSFFLNFKPGMLIADHFTEFSIEMLKILPCAFILIGLFDVWVKKESIEKHLGANAGKLSYIWPILLASTTVGGLYVAFPVAYALYKKGAKLSIIFTYIGASGICRIPMTLFEASFLGIKFSLIRLAISIPLVIITSILLGNYLEKHKYQLKNGEL